jgi:hypothetical protein
LCCVQTGVKFLLPAFLNTRRIPRELHANGDRRQATNLQEIATLVGGLFDEVFSEGTNRA